MKQTVRTAVYDESLQIEAYRLQGTQLSRVLCHRTC